jgi:hypothetical protein
MLPFRLVRCSPFVRDDDDDSDDARDPHHIYNANLLWIGVSLQAYLVLVAYFKRPSL